MSKKTWGRGIRQGTRSQPWVQRKADKCWLEDVEGSRVLQCFFTVPDTRVEEVLDKSGGLNGGKEGIYFLEAQEYGIDENITYQDNLSVMLLEKNGKKSSTKNTKHINV